MLPPKRGGRNIPPNHFWAAAVPTTGTLVIAMHEIVLPLLHQALQRHTALEWESVFGDEVPCAAVRTVEDMFDHPQVQAQGLVTEFEHPQVGRYRGFCRPIEFSRTPGPDPFAAPTLGQHSDAVRQATGG